jgi:hypothetical protein
MELMNNFLLIKVRKEENKMSYDLQIKVKIESCNIYKTIAVPEYDNPTYNLRKIFETCMNWNYSQGKTYKCSDIIKNIENGIVELKCNKNKYKKLEPKNGWGNVEDAIKVLESLRECIFEQSEEIPIEHLYMCW